MTSLDSFFYGKKKRTPKKAISPDESKLLNQLSEESNQNDLSDVKEVESPIEELDSSTQDEWGRDTIVIEEKEQINNNVILSETTESSWFTEITKEQLSNFLIEVVQRDPLYPGRLAWVRDRILPFEPEITS
ncbi:MAG: hypothetical protein ACFFDT_32265, partial [Candidatus Hodarchaeota archaeon]